MYWDLLISSIRSETSSGFILRLARCTDRGKIELPAPRGVGLESELTEGFSCTKHSRGTAVRQRFENTLCSRVMSVLGFFPPFQLIFEALNWTRESVWIKTPPPLRVSQRSPVTSRVGAITEEQARPWAWDREEGETSLPQRQQTISPSSKLLSFNVFFRAP